MAVGVSLTVERFQKKKDYQQISNETLITFLVLSNFHHLVLSSMAVL
jgi:hypothetical protein